jgi:pimeloyl-ACP methyl ester carboxylesterase
LSRELAAFFLVPPPKRPGRNVPRGDGHPVIVFPAFLYSDNMTRPLRRYLDACGYRTRGWGLGRCLEPSNEVLEGTAALVAETAQHYGRKVSLIGISLGGILAREAARRHPQLVRQVITLCSPFRLPTASNAEVFFRLLSANHTDAFAHLLPTLSVPPPVPTTSIYTRADGIVAWQSCLNPETPLSENIEVTGAHGTISRNRKALAIVAERLAQSEGSWRPYRDQAREIPRKTAAIA